MKKSFTTTTIIAALVVLLIGSITFPSCNKYDNPQATVTVLNGEDGNKPVEGVIVRIYSDPTFTDTSHQSHDAYINPDSLIRDEIQETDKLGQTHHEFEFESILHVEAKLGLSKTDTLVGYGALILKNDENYHETIILKYKSPSI